MEIREIKITGNPIPEINVFDSSIPQVFTGYPVPVTVNIGLPIVDMPGCVEAHPDGSPQLAQDDSRGARTYCDGNIPSFNPINFEPNQLLPTQKPKADTRQPKAPAAPDLPIPKTPPATAKVDCPTADQQAKEPVGTYIEGFRKKVTDYQLIGKQCIQITEQVPLPEQIVAGLPSAGSVVTTGGIAVVATASALMAKPLADLLLKVVKPTVKKVMKKIAAIRGKSVPALSVAERRDLQRERSHAIRVLRQTLKPKG